MPRKLERAVTARSLLLGMYHPERNLKDGGAAVPQPATKSAVKRSMYHKISGVYPSSSVKQ